MIDRLIDALDNFVDNYIDNAENGFSVINKWFGAVGSFLVTLLVCWPVLITAILVSPMALLGYLKNKFDS